MAPFPARRLTAGLLALAIGCGSATPRLEAGVYREGAIAFRVGDVPSSWRAVRVEGATLAYRDEAHRASILLDGRCYRKDDDVPLLALTDHLVMGTTEREFTSQETLPFDGRDAMCTPASGRSSTASRWTTTSSSSRRTLASTISSTSRSRGPSAREASDASAAPATDDGTSAFERFTGTFHTLPGAGHT